MQRNHRLTLFGAAMLVSIAGCNSDPVDASQNPPPSTSAPFIVARSTASASVQQAYFSLPSGSLPNIVVATIAVPRTGAQLSLQMIDGGFDPIALPAAPGDSVVVSLVQENGLAPITNYRFTINAAEIPPVIIRTDPPPHKRDVPLNASIRVVFSEPMASGTLNAIALHLGASVVTGDSHFTDETHTAVEFTPSAPLSGTSDYQLIVTTAATETSGKPLSAVDSVTFTTGSAQAAPAPVASILLSPGSTTIRTNAVVQLSATPRDASGAALSGRTITWSSSAPTVATVSSTGRVNAISEGTATITASSAGVLANSTVVVSNTVIGSVTVNAPTTDLFTGTAVQLTATVLDDHHAPVTNRSVVWSSSQPSVATISSDGTVTPLTTGSVSITATVGGVSGSVQLTVFNAGPVSSVVFVAPDPAVMGPGQTRYLSAILRDAQGHPITFGTIAFESSAPAVASVSGSTLTANSAGTAVITATSQGKSSSYTLTVLPATSYLEVHAGGDFSCALTFGGKVLCWGGNASGQLGNGSTASSTAPVLISNNNDFVELSTGRAHACAVTNTRAAYCWGDNTSGQLGVGNNTNSAIPQLVHTPSMVLSVTAGGNHTCAVSPAGAPPTCWGDNQYGQLGNGTTVSSNVPVSIGLGLLPFVTVSAGANHTCGSTGSSIYCWGRNASGQVGNGTNVDVAVPALVTNVLTRNIRVGDNFSCVEFECWGDNSSGQFANGTTLSTNTPVLQTVPFGYDETESFFPGGSHMCVITSALSNIGCVGSNGHGELGDGTTTNKSVAVALPAPAPGFRFASGGPTHTCGVTFYGIIYCWGDNSQAQLGTGSFASSSVPVKVIGQP